MRGGREEPLHFPAVDAKKLSTEDTDGAYIYHDTPQSDFSLLEIPVPIPCHPLPDVYHGGPFSSRLRQIVPLADREDGF